METTITGDITNVDFEQANNSKCNFFLVIVVVSGAHLVRLYPFCLFFFTSKLQNKVESPTTSCPHKILCVPQPKPPPTSETRMALESDGVMSRGVCERYQGQRKPGGSEGSKSRKKSKCGGFKKSRAGFNAKVGESERSSKKRESVWERGRERFGSGLGCPRFSNSNSRAAKQL